MNIFKSSGFLLCFLAALCISTQTRGQQSINRVAFPIVYRPEYNISFGPLDYLHAFDGSKYGRVAQKIAGYIYRPGNKSSWVFPQWAWQEAFYKPEQASLERLRLVHTQAYLDSLNSSATVAQILGIPLLKFLPNALLQWRILKPMRYATAGTIEGAQLALKYGKAINLSGGYHHAKPHQGDGSCVYADIPLAIRVLWQENPQLKVMVVDLDAHQGNGVAESLKDELIKPDRRVALFDMYNADRYPGPGDGTRKYITYSNLLHERTSDKIYKNTLETNLPIALDQFKPDFIIYNAGTDIFAEDTIGGMSISEKGIIARDQFVFEQAKKRKIPILMVLSGGYTKKSAGIIAASIINLIKLYE